MKKILLAFAALCAFSFAASAKPAKLKVNGWKDAAKLADKYDLNVVRDYTDYYVAKSGDGKEFVVYFKKDYADCAAILAMTCLDGTLLSKTTFIDKEDEGGFLPKFSMTEGDKKAIFENGGDATYALRELGFAQNTVEVMYQRAKHRSLVCKEFGLVLPETVKKNEENFQKTFDAQKAGMDKLDVCQKIIDSYFAF